MEHHKKIALTYKSLFVNASGTQLLGCLSVSTEQPVMKVSSVCHSVNRRRPFQITAGMDLSLFERPLCVIELCIQRSKNRGGASNHALSPPGNHQYMIQPCHFLVNSIWNSYHPVVSTASTQPRCDAPQHDQSFMSRMYLLCVAADHVMRRAPTLGLVIHQPRGSQAKSVPTAQQDLNSSDSFSAGWCVLYAAPPTAAEQAHLVNKKGACSARRCSAVMRQASCASTNRSEYQYQPSVPRSSRWKKRRSQPRSRNLRKAVAGRRSPPSRRVDVLVLWWVLAPQLCTRGESQQGASLPN